MITVSSHSLHAPRPAARRAFAALIGAGRFALTLLFCPLLAGCMDDFLSTSSATTVSVDEAYESLVMTEAAIQGVYSSLPGAFASSMTIWQGNTDIEITQNFSESGYNDVSGNIAPANYYDNANNNNTHWRDIYDSLESAKTAVYGIRNSSLLDTDPDDMLPFLGEALTLRALVAYHLVCLYGDIPYDEDPSESDLSNVNIGKVDKDSILTWLVRDLQEAQEYLPWLGEDSDRGVERVTKGFAKGLMARIALYAGGWLLHDSNTFPDSDHEMHATIEAINGYYVGRRRDWEDYYAIASTQCAEILGSADNPHQLDPDFEDIWSTVTGKGYNSYNENLFEIGHGVGSTGDVGATTGYYVAGGSQYSTRSLGGMYMGHHAYYFYSFTPTDTRRDVTCCWQYYTSDNVETLDNDIFAVNCGKWRIYWMCDTYLTLFSAASSRISTGINWILMRYSDIYLMFAEAEYGLYGNADLSNETAGMTPRQALEAVRTRAFGSGSEEITNYADDFLEAIMNERAWEFGGECIRKDDLVRWGNLNDKIDDMKKAFCLMADLTQPITFFDKTYDPEDFPTTVYYEMESNGEYIDLSTVNFFADDDASGTYSTRWFPYTYGRRGSHTEYLDDPAMVLTACTGINASYDYSDFLSTLTYGSEIAELLADREMGNGTCNHRHVFAIYYEDIYKANYAYTNAYGY